MSKGRFTYLLLVIFLCVVNNLSAQDGGVDVVDPESRIQQKRDRGLINLNTLFIPKGEWIVGGAASYSTHDNSSFTFVVIDDIESFGYTLSVTPIVAYSIANNMAVGARFGYSRNLIKIASAAINFGEGDDGINLSTKDYYGLTHRYSMTAIWRQYIPLGKNKRFALFNEFQLEAGGAQSKFAFDSPVQGTYATTTDVSLGVSPGLTAFATNNIAVEINVGVFGISYSKTKQVHNQVEVGEAKSGMINSKINLFSIGFGVAFYI